MLKKTLRMIAVLWLTACGGSAGTQQAAVELVCQPGKSVSCACSSGEVGAQICDDDGAGWGICMCLDAGAGAGSGGDANGGTPGHVAGAGGVASSSGEGGSQISAGASGSAVAAGAGGAAAAECYTAEPAQYKEACTMRDLVTYYGKCKVPCHPVSPYYGGNPDTDAGAYCCPR